MKFLSSLREKISHLKPRQNAEQVSTDKRQERAFIAGALIFGLLCAWCLCLIADSALLSRALDSEVKLAGNISRRNPSFANAKAGGDYEGFAKVNPFGADLPPEEDKNNGGNNTYPAESLSLAGTLPHIGAWIRDDEGTHMVLVRQEIKGWKLEDVRYGRVLLSHNGESHALYIVLAGDAPAIPSPSASGGGSKKIDFSGIQRSEGNKEGTMPREVLDKLLMNPYDEMAKMRMVPADNGMRFDRIAPDSVLGLVGVTQGDVIKAINGVTISNMSDLTNAVNSMMSGSRFDVTVDRGGKPLDLKYQVK